MGTGDGVFTAIVETAITDGCRDLSLLSDMIKE